MTRFGEILPFWLLFKAGREFFLGKSSQAKWLLFGKDQFLPFLSEHEGSQSAIEKI